MGHLLATEGREGLGVVGAGRSTATAAAASELAAGTVGTTIAAVAAEATSATSSTLAAVATVAATATSTASTTSTGRRAILSKEAARVDIGHVNSNLLLLFTEASSLAAAAGHVLLLIRVAGECLALWELLAGALVGLADVVGDGELLRGLLLEIVVVALGLDLWLGWLSILAVLWWWHARVEALGLLGLCDGLASLLVGELGLTSLSTPAMSCLLWVLTIARSQYCKCSAERR